METAVTLLVFSLDVAAAAWLASRFKLGPILQILMTVIITVPLVAGSFFALVAISCRISPSGCP